MYCSLNKNSTIKLRRENKVKSIFNSDVKNSLWFQDVQKEEVINQNYSLFGDKEVVYMCACIHT